MSIILLFPDHESLFSISHRTPSLVNHPFPFITSGNLSYKEISEKASDVFPSTEDEECTRCGRCADVCPTNAITIDTTVITEPRLCTSCSACVKVCPVNARTWKHPTIMKAINWLNSNCQERKEPETYL